jgi:hypothetical protein
MRENLQIWYFLFFTNIRARKMRSHFWKKKGKQAALSLEASHTGWPPELLSQVSQVSQGPELFSFLRPYLNFSQVHTFIPRIEFSLHPEVEKEPLVLMVDDSKIQTTTLVSFFVTGLLLAGCGTSLPLPWHMTPTTPQRCWVKAPAQVVFDNTRL